MSLGMSPWGLPSLPLPSLRTGWGCGGRSHSPDAPGEFLQFSQKTMQTPQYMAPKYIVSLKLYANCKIEKKTMYRRSSRGGNSTGNCRLCLNTFSSSLYICKLMPILLLKLTVRNCLTPIQCPFSQMHSWRKFLLLYLVKIKNSSHCHGNT